MTKVKRKKSPRPSPQSLTPCPLCLVMLKPQNLPRHLRTVHPQPHSCLTDRAPSWEDTLIASDEPSPDATHPYAHAYRERGRFGSHPSHDPFDDDSGPY